MARPTSAANGFRHDCFARESLLHPRSLRRHSLSHAILCCPAICIRRPRISLPHTSQLRTQISARAISPSDALGHASASRRSSSYPYGYASLPFPFFGDSFDPDDIYSTGYPVASPPPPFLMQALSGLAGGPANSLEDAMSPAAHQPSSTDPLMIELQNGRYVRVTNTAANGDALPLASTPALSAKPSSIRSTSTPAARYELRAAAAARCCLTATPAARRTHLSRRTQRRSPRLHHRRRLPLRPRRLLHRRILEQENRSLRDQPEPNSPSQRRPQGEFRSPHIAERSHHPPLVFLWFVIPSRSLARNPYPSQSDVGPRDSRRHVIPNARAQRDRRSRFRRREFRNLRRNKLRTCKIASANVEERRFSAASRLPQMRALAPEVRARNPPSAPSSTTPNRARQSSVSWYNYSSARILLTAVNTAV